MAHITHNGAYDLEKCNKITIHGKDIIVITSEDWNIQDVIIHPYNSLYANDIQELSIRIVRKEK